MDKRIIFIDLDGTIKNDDRQVPQANIDAITQAKAAGHELVIATGRPFQYNQYINNKCENVFRYAVSSTGAIIYDFATQSIIATNPIPQTAVEAICKLDQPEIIWIMHCTDGLYSSEEHRDRNKIEVKQITRPIAEFFKTKTVCAICIVSTNFDIIKNLEPDILAIPCIQISNRSKVLTDSSYPRHQLAYYDITATGVSKGFGIKTLCDMLGIPKEHRIAIGDDINDLPMFAECGFKVAMGNALPKVKEIADHITDDKQ
jgi:hypothetical protein